MARAISSKRKDSNEKLGENDSKEFRLIKNKVNLFIILQNIKKNLYVRLFILVYE